MPVRKVKWPSPTHESCRGLWVSTFESMADDTMCKDMDKGMGMGMGIAEIEMGAR